MGINITSKRIRNHIIAILTILLSIIAVCIGVGNETYAASSSDIKAGDHVYAGKRNVPGFTGYPYWRVLDKNTEGDLLLLSEYLWTGKDYDEFIQFNPVDTSIAPESRVYNQDWQGSNAQAWCRDFEEAVLDNINGLTIKETTKSDGECSADDAGVSFYAVENILNKDRVFFLSAEEVKQYMPLKESRTAYRYDGKDNYYIREKVSDSWWLRSPRMEAPKHCVGEVVGEGVARKGFITNRTVDYLLPARPAMWATFSEDACLKKTGTGEWSLCETHDYKAAYEWSSDNSKCTARNKCVNCGDVIDSEEAVSEKSEKPATLTTDGYIRYTVRFSKPEFTDQTKEIRIAKKYNPVVGILDGKLPKVSIKGPSKAKKSFTAKWKKLSKKNQKKVQGIEIQYAQDSRFTRGMVIKTAKKTKISLKVKKLKSKSTYWVRVRSYKKVGGFKHVSAWSKAKKVKVK